MKELSEQWDAKRKQLADAVDQATVKRDDGTVQYDPSKVKAFGEGLSATAVVEKMRETNAELDDLGTQIEQLQEVEKAAGRVGEPEPFKHPSGSEPGPGAKAGGGIIQPIGKQVVDHPEYKAWIKSGHQHGVTIRLPDALPSDFLAKAATPSTIGAKTLMQTTAGWGPESVRMGGYVEAVTRPIQLLDILPMGQTGQEQIVYMEETTRTHAAAETAEGNAYAESTFELTEKNSPVRKITDSLPVTDEQLEDVAMVQGYINDRLMFGVRQRFDTQALVGNGTPPNLEGLANVTGIQTQAKSTDTIEAAFHKAITKVRVTGRAMPTHNVMHSTDWEKVRLRTDTNGQYIWGPPSEAGPQRMWGLPVALNEASSAGTGWVGSFMPAYVSAFERRGIDVQVGYVGTQFTEGKRTVRADMRVALVFFRPAAFAEVTGL